jgi:hypothetical protein
MRDVSLLLLDILSRRIPSAGRRWQERLEGITGVQLGEGLARASFTTLPEFDRDGFLAQFTGAPRSLGKDPLALTAAERGTLVAAGVTWPIEGWPLDQLGRVGMLALAAARLSPRELEWILDACYRQGDSRERQAVLRSLPFMEWPEGNIPRAVDACRTNEVPIFEAIACENPFPAAHFPDLPWNQMVLKALFLGIALDRILGLERRKSAELARMAEDYASERRAAGRSVPADIGRLALETDEDRATRIPE